MNITQRKVQEFNEVFGPPVRYQLSVPPAEERHLIVKLIAEELKELAVSLGVPINVVLGPVECVEPDSLVDLVNAAREYADLIYVVEQGNVRCGIIGDAVFDEVHRTNMEKAPYSEGLAGVRVVTRRADGKVLKPEGWKPPDIKGVLDACEDLRLAGVDLYDRDNLTLNYKSDWITSAETVDKPETP